MVFLWVSFFCRFLSYDFAVFPFLIDNFFSHVCLWITKTLNCTKLMEFIRFCHLWVFFHCNRLLELSWDDCLIFTFPSFSYTMPASHPLQWAVAMVVRSWMDVKCWRQNTAYIYNYFIFMKQRKKLDRQPSIICNITIWFAFPSSIFNVSRFS